MEMQSLYTCPSICMRHISEVTQQLKFDISINHILILVGPKQNVLNIPELRQLLGSHCKGPGYITEQTMWDLPQIKWQWGKYFSSLRLNLPIVFLHTLSSEVGKIGPFESSVPKDSVLPHQFSQNNLIVKKLRIMKYRHFLSDYEIVLKTYYVYLEVLGKKQEYCQV